MRGTKTGERGRGRGSIGPHPRPRPRSGIEIYPRPRPHPRRGRGFFPDAGRAPTGTGIPCPVAISRKTHLLKRSHKKAPRNKKRIS